MSLSARRAWIEIDIEGKLDADLWVALRKESVDRNTNSSPASLFDLSSLSARRAWIEIYDGLIASANFCRSLSARRAWIEMDVTAKTGLFTSSRSPQGERG